MRWRTEPVVARLLKTPRLLLRRDVEQVTFGTSQAAQCLGSFRLIAQANRLGADANETRPEESVRPALLRQVILPETRLGEFYVAFKRLAVCQVRSGKVAQAQEHRIAQRGLGQRGRKSLDQNSTGPAVADVEHQRYVDWLAALVAHIVVALTESGIPRKGVDETNLRRRRKFRQQLHECHIAAPCLDRPLATFLLVRNLTRAEVALVALENPLYPGRHPALQIDFVRLAVLLEYALVAQEPAHLGYPRREAKRYLMPCISFGRGDVDAVIWRSLDQLGVERIDDIEFRGLPGGRGWVVWHHEHPGPIGGTDVEPGTARGVSDHPQDRERHPFADERLIGFQFRNRLVLVLWRRLDLRARVVVVPVGLERKAYFLGSTLADPLAHDVEVFVKRPAGITVERDDVKLNPAERNQLAACERIQIGHRPP